MGVRVNGTIGVSNMLLRLDTTAKRRVLRELYAQAYRTRDLARKFAPRDVDNLEEAIKVRPEQQGPMRDEAGRFARQEIEVYIDMEMPVPERQGKTIGDYAYEIHEHLFPYGPWQLGENSVAKQQGQSEQVGGGFLERAAEQIERQLDKVLLDILRDL
jgi:hypothetical protein